MTSDRLGLEVLDRARRDAGVFAEVLLGAPLWPHQLEVVASPAQLLMQQGRLELPRHPSLLLQLAALEFSMTEGGVMRIAVPAAGRA